MFGDAGCGVGWSVSVTPTCLSRLIFGLLTNINGKVYVMQCNSFPVSKRLMFVFTLTNGMEWGGKVEWKKRNVWRPGVFSLFSGMFHLVKARQWEGTCVLCWSERFGDFSRGCVLTKRVWVRMNLRCVRVFEGELRLFEEPEAEFFGAHEWKRWRLCRVCVWASLAYFVPHWATESNFFCGKGVITHTQTHMLIQKRTPGGDEWMAGLTTTQGFYWWHHYWASGHSTLSTFREPFSQLLLHQGSFTDVTSIAYFLEIIHFSRLQPRTKYFTVESDGTINSRSSMWLNHRCQYSEDMCEQKWIKSVPCFTPPIHV